LSSCTTGGFSRRAQLHEVGYAGVICDVSCGKDKFEDLQEPTASSFKDEKRI
jgi:hypothetical protein